MTDAEMRLFILATEATSITGALEDLRENRLDRALEALEQQLDTATVMLGEIAAKDDCAMQESAMQTLRLIHEYRQKRPRCFESDMSEFDQGLVDEVRHLQERARIVLDRLG